MSPARSGMVNRDLEALWTSGTFTGLGDAQLLSRFASGGGEAAEAAFRELVERHGPMVLGVCRQILRRAQDVDDAFQVTFLVLVRKARSIRVGDSLAPWLYGVAYRTAVRARAAAARLRTDAIEPAAMAADSPSDGAFEFDVRPMLHEELARLPGKYREPIVLCHLEGKSHEEAARLLSWPVGTVSGRLSRGRELLRARLERRGVSASPAMVAARWLPEAQAALSPCLVEVTLAAAARFVAAGTISSPVPSLAQGVLRAMLLHKIKLITLAIVAVGATSGGLAWAIRASRAAGPPVTPQVGPAAAPRAAQEAAQPPPNPPATPPPGTVAPAVIDPFGPPGRLGGLGQTSPVTPVSKNYPNLVDFRHPLPVLRSSAILVVESPDRGSVQAMSLDSPKAAWQRLPIPPGITAAPILNEDTVALILKGKAIDRIAAFSRYTGGWSTQNLRRPIEEEITPYLLPGGAVYQASNDVYAFSSHTGLWGALHLEGSDRPKVSASVNDIEVMQGNRLYVFSLRHGRFSAGVDVNPEMFRRVPQAARPAR